MLSGMMRGERKGAESAKILLSGMMQRIELLCVLCASASFAFNPDSSGMGNHRNMLPGN
jgi:hypothetical protein